MSQLRSALAALAAEDLHGMFGPQLLDRTRELVAARNRIEAELTRTVRECELTLAAEHDGLKTMQAWLRGHAHLSPTAASTLVRTGRALGQLPVTEAAFTAGALTGEQVAVIAPVAAPDAQAAAHEQGVDTAGIDTVLAQVAATRPYAELRQVVAHYRARLDPDGPEPDPTEGRSLVFARHTDGSVSFRGELDAVGGEKLQLAVESLRQTGRCAGDPRGHAQQSADALVQLADNALAAGDLPRARTVKPHLYVTVPLADLLDPTTAPGAAQTGMGAVLSAARARWATCDGAVTRIVLGPEGQPLDLGREVRLFPTHLRRAAVQRDRSCVFAGCDAPHWWCEMHHLAEWVADEGETSLDNSGLLCERHHTKVHHGFRIERDNSGRWHTYRPDGTEIPTAEPLLV